jgi:Chalcone isomerase-like
MKFARFPALLGFLLLCQTATAREVAGVQVPENATLPGHSAPLVLNGAGVRSKFFVKVYVGALYLPKREASAAAILAAPAPASVRLHFLHSEVEVAKLVSAWNDGFAANQDEATLNSLRPRIEQFNGLFRTVHKGDSIRIDLLPAEGTQVWINEELRGTVPGTDFHKALLEIWLGAKPADGNLKEGMLSG